MNLPAQQHPSPGQNYKGTQVHFGALVSAVVICSIIFVTLNQFTSTFVLSLTAQTDIFFAIAVVVAALAYLLARRMHKKGAGTAKNLTGTINEKITYHRSYLIRYLAMCELGAMVSLIFFFLTGDYRLLAITGVMLVSMLAVTPTKKRLVQELGLSSQEESEL